MRSAALTTSWMGTTRLMGAGPELTGPINIGNPHEIPGCELAVRVIALINSKSKIVHRPLLQDDPIQRCPDITTAQSELSWQPKVPLDDGLSRTIAYFDALLRQ